LCEVQGKPFIDFPEDHHFWFKVKGDEHATSHVKTLKEKPAEALAKVKDVEDFVTNVVTPARL